MWSGWGFDSLVGLRPRPDATIAVLCRNNAPLMGLAMKLLRQGIGVTVQGRDIGKQLIALSRKIVRADDTPADTCRGLIRDWSEGEVALAIANDHEERVEGILDRPGPSGRCSIPGWPAPPGSFANCSFGCSRPAAPR